jgi:hypothetical protein
MPAAAVMFGFGFIGYAAGANIGKASAGSK